MLEEEKNHNEYYRDLSNISLKRWHDLPDFSVYSDQLLQIVNEELFYLKSSSEALITKSMINNYVKWGMMPKPNKKKYDRIHIATALIITLLKQILPIVKIKDGIQLQVIIEGEEKAYDSFCLAFENAMQRIFTPLSVKTDFFEFDRFNVSHEKLAITAITTALANKLLTEKIIETKLKQIESKQIESKKIEENQIESKSKESKPKESKPKESKSEKAK